ncbi:MAG: transposase [Nitrososphaerota archaeon]|jgi:hypothetical protein|nr:transposase [Nitrososphaerota archaeon]MDG6930698.1 transposase [Nitrososphaerota archaeon]
MINKMRPNRDSARKLFKLSSKVLNKKLDMPMARNSKYSATSIIRSLIFMSVTNTSAETGSRYLSRLADVPSPDTVLRRLKELGLNHAVSSLNEANILLAKKYLKDGIKMTIDYTEEPYYGKIDMYVTRGKYKSGTDRFHTFATISVVGKDEGVRLTLYALPVTRLDDKKEVVRKLLANSPKPSLLLMDRGFFTGDVIKLLEELNINFIIPAVKNEKVKRTIKQHLEGGPAVIDYNMGTNFYLVIAQRRNCDKPEDKYMAFATNLRFDSPEQMIDAVPEEYKYR